MRPALTFSFWLSIAGLVLGLASATLARRRREVPGAMGFLAAAGAISWWSLCHAGTFLASDPAGMALWANLQFVVPVFLPLIWLAVAMDHAGLRRYLAPRFAVPLAAIPVLTLALLWTNRFHGLMGAGLPALTLHATGSPGGQGWPWMAVFTAYSALLVLAAIIVLLRAASNQTGVSRGHALALALASCLPGALVLAVAGRLLGWAAPLDPAPVAGLLGAGLLVWSIRHHGLFDLALAARAELIERLEDAVIVLDVRGQVADFNPAATALPVLSRPLARGQSAQVLFGGAPPLLDLAAASTARHSEIALRCNGSTAYFEVQSAPLQTRRGRPAGQLLLLRHIGEHKAQEAMLRKTMLALQAQNAELETFARTLAQDLQRPLSQIRGLAQAIGTDNGDLTADERLWYSRLMRENARQMTGIIHGLLILAEVRRKEVRPHPLDMAALIGQALQRLAPLIEERSAVIKQPAEWPIAYGHAPWMVEMWISFLGYALREARTPARLAIGSRVDGDFVRFWVSNNGPGGPGAGAPQPISPTAPSGNDHPAGDGLGLAMACRIVERLGGQSSIKSIPGAGSTLFFTLRRVPEPGERPEDAS